MWVYLLIAILFILGVVLIFLINLPGTFEVRVSRRYNTDINTVFNTLCNFHSWPNWSPWLIHEPDTRLQYSDNVQTEGGYYSWDGNIVGAGKLRHETIQKPNLIQQQLEFFRPYKNTAKTAFELSQSENQTEVSWVLHGTMPFLMRFMIPKMKQMITKDYELGLAMLAGELDANAEHPKITFDGETILTAQACICKGFEGGLEAMQAAMEKGFPELAEYLTKQGANPVAEPRAFYHKVDIKKMWFRCDMAVPVSKDFSSVDYPIKTLGAGKYFAVSVMGSYEFLELAWNAAMSHIFMAKYKLDNKRPSFEVYATDPAQVSNTNEIKTILYIPIK